MLNYSLSQIFCSFVLLILKLILVCIPQSCPLYNLHNDKLFQHQSTDMKADLIMQYLQPITKNINGRYMKSTLLSEETELYLKFALFVSIRLGSL